MSEQNERDDDMQMSESPKMRQKKPKNCTIIQRRYPLLHYRRSGEGPKLDCHGMSFSLFRADADL